MATYVIFGATGGIGRALVEQLSSAHIVIAVGREQVKLDQLQQEFSSIEVHPLTGTTLEAYQQALSAIQQQYDSIDGVAHAVGSILLKPVGMISLAEWQETLDINLNSAFFCVRAIAQVIKQNCSTVLFSSAAASLGLPNHEAIAAAKAGVEGLMRSAAASYAAKNLRFNCIAPGLTQTPLTEKIFASERAVNFSTQMHGLNRLGRPEQIASMAAWLLDPQNDWMTGEVIHLDGGLSTVKLGG